MKVDIIGMWLKWKFSNLKKVDIVILTLFITNSRFIWYLLLNIPICVCCETCLAISHALNQDEFLVNFQRV